MIKVNMSIACVIMAATQVFAQKATVYTTTEDKSWIKTYVKLTEGTHSPAADIIVCCDSLLQPVDGFGGTFSERGWDAMQVLSPEQQLSLVQEFFGADGIHFAWGRTPVGGNDFSLSTYTYNDVPQDWTQRNFSIARDRYILLPFIKLAKQVRPDLRMWASPWTPPYWMKLSEHYSEKSHGINGTDQAHNCLDPNYWVYPNVTAFKMTDGCLRSYAIYLSKYLQEYEREGVHIDILMPQNEVQWQPCWQSCTWQPEDFAIFIAQYLGPQLEQDSIKTDLWLGTVNYPKPEWVFRFFENDKVGQYIKGVGMQWTGMQAMPKVHERMPKMPLMQTEGICGDGDNDWKDMEKSWERMVHCFHSGARSYMQWNLVLGDDLESLFEWKQNALVIIDRQAGFLTRTPEYYLMKHFSHFIQPGSYLLKTKGDKNLLPFLTGDGKIVLVAYNPEVTTDEKIVSINGQVLVLSLKAKSINTIVI